MSHLAGTDPTIATTTARRAFCNMRPPCCPMLCAATITGLRENMEGNSSDDGAEGVLCAAIGGGGKLPPRTIRIGDDVYNTILYLRTNKAKR